MTDEPWAGNERTKIVVWPGLTFEARLALCDETVIDEVIWKDTYRVADLDVAGMMVVDLGAHIGVFSAWCAQRGAGAVIAVEPQPENLELLRDAIRVNQRTLAQILDQYAGDGVDLLKADMEGGEVDALVGCDHERLSRVQQIVAETHGPASCPFLQTSRVAELVAWLSVTHDVTTEGSPEHLGRLWATAK